MLLILALACSPDLPEKAVDTGGITLDSSGWVGMGCDVDGVYLLSEIEQQAGPPPWLFEAWILDGEVWAPESYEVLDSIVQVWWSFDPAPGECGLWVLSLN